MSRTTGASRDRPRVPPRALPKVPGRGSVGARPLTRTALGGAGLQPAHGRPCRSSAGQRTVDGAAPVRHPPDADAARASSSGSAASRSSSRTSSSTPATTSCTVTPVPVVIDGLEALLDRPGVFVFGSNDYCGPTPTQPARYLLPAPASASRARAAVARPPGGVRQRRLGRSDEPARRARLSTGRRSPSPASTIRT